MRGAAAPRIFELELLVELKLLVYSDSTTSVYVYVGYGHSRRPLRTCWPLPHASYSKSYQLGVFHFSGFCVLELMQTTSRQLAEYLDITTPVYSPITTVGYLATPRSTTDNTQFQNLPAWHVFKLVGDNLDKTSCRRHQTHDAQTVSMHHFHYYAVMDRIDLSNLSDQAPEKPQEINGNLFLPTQLALRQSTIIFTHTLLGMSSTMENGTME